MRMLWRKCAPVAGEDPAREARWGAKTMDSTYLEPSGNVFGMADGQVLYVFNTT